MSEEKHDQIIGFVIGLIITIIAVIIGLALAG